MRYATLIVGIIAIASVCIIRFYPDKVAEFVDEYFNKKEYVIAKPNKYFLDNAYSYLENYTDDVSNKKELLNYIYYVINTGSEYADGSCTKSYTNCIEDIQEISDDQVILTAINNFVHPYNSFRTITFTYDNRGNFSMAIEHVYSKEEIAGIDYIVQSVIEKTITSTMTSQDKIKAIHDFVIDNTEYDKLKANNINDTTYKSNTAYGPLVQGYGICTGYSDTMAIFLDALDIKNYKITGKEHVWNLVYINGAWKHLDATWDDPVSEYNADRDMYFLVSTDELMKLDEDDTHIFDKTIYAEAYS